MRPGASQRFPLRVIKDLPRPFDPKPLPNTPQHGVRKLRTALILALDGTGDQFDNDNSTTSNVC